MPQPRQLASASSLPPGFVTVKDILNGEKVRERSRVNVVGIVTDFRVPVPTNGAGKHHPHILATSRVALILILYRLEVSNKIIRFIC